MKIGFLSACLPQISLENLVKWAAESGFQSLELAAWPVESKRDSRAATPNGILEIGVVALPNARFGRD